MADAIWYPRDDFDEVELAIRFAPKPIDYADVWSGNADTDKYWRV